VVTNEWEIFDTREKIRAVISELSDRPEIGVRVGISISTVCRQILHLGGHCEIGLTLSSRDGDSDLKFDIGTEIDEVDWELLQPFLSIQRVERRSGIGMNCVAVLTIPRSSISPAVRDVLVKILARKSRDALMEEVKSKNIELERHRADLEQLNVGLQQRVEERTQELAERSHEFERLSIYQSVLIDSIPNPIFVKDKDGIFTSCNKAFEEAFGHQRESIIGKTILELEGISSEKAESYHQKDLDNIRASEDTFEEVIAHFSDGSPRHMVAQRRPFRMPDGSIGGLLVVLVDITERKRMEEEIAESREAAEAANNAKSAFLANMSHELRTPMNAIIGYTEMLAEDAEDDGLEEMASDLGKIESSAKHLLSLINDVLDLSKIEAGRMELYCEEFDLIELLRGIEDTVQTLVDRNSNELIVDLPSSDLTVYADSTKIRQCMLNLLSNACKFTSEGRIILSVSPIRIAGTEYVDIAVADSGIGVPEDKLATLFEEFTQADASTTKNFGGTGLGLAISKRFCEMMGGTIEVESEIGVGTTFTARIPLRVELDGEAQIPGDAD
jgi:PAS domain S-box-containing protein